MLAILHTQLTFLLLYLAEKSWALAETDCVSYGCDPTGSGYNSRHKISPDLLKDPNFRILWNQSFLEEERFYAQPLVYTPVEGRSIVLTASTRNFVRTLDAATGEVVQERLLENPVLETDIGCNNIPFYYGIVGTPVIDPATDTVYLFASGYRNNDQSGGFLNITYKFYALNVLDLTDRPGYPILVDGRAADNAPDNYFLGGLNLQRGGLVIVNTTVFGGFGTHCNQFNYTGWVAGGPLWNPISETQADLVLDFLFTTAAPPFAPPVITNVSSPTGGKAGIWQGGFAITTDGTYLYCATGNGPPQPGFQENSLEKGPADGREGLSQADNSILKLGEGPNGQGLLITDYFQPFDYASRNPPDMDLGAGGVALLDSSVFRSRNGERMALQAGKLAKLYVVDTNDLGGFANGPNLTDDVLQSFHIPLPGADVSGGLASYPGEGGYIFVNKNGGPMMAYKYDTENEIFQFAGASVGNSSTASTPSVTSLNGEPGTAVVWSQYEYDLIPYDLEPYEHDPDLLKAWHAVPSSDGELVKIPLPEIGDMSRFLHLGFGDARVYLAGLNNNIMCLGIQ